MKRSALLLAAVLVLLTSCKNDGDGQLVGVKDRPDFLDLMPYGMVYVPAGHYLMGAGDQDVPFAFTHQSKNVTISAFYMDETEIRQKADEALTLMIHDYSRFRVETIDSFFQSVMRNLARELELGANLNIDLDNLNALSEAVDSMIEKLDRNSPVLYWLLDYIDERIQNDKQWNVASEIKEFGKDIFKEEYIEKGAALRKTLEDKDCIKNYRKILNALEEEALEQMKGFAQQFFGYRQR